MIKNFFLENNFLSIGILILLIISTLLLSDFLKAKNQKNHEEIFRKIPHIVIGVILSLAPIFMTRNEIIISAIILFIGVWTGKHSPFLKNIFSVKRITWGMWLTPISLGIMSWIWLPENILPFIVGMLVLTFSDALAAIFGRIYGNKKIPFTTKTFIGSFSFFLSTFIIFYILSTGAVWKIILISIFLTFWELILIFGFDNLIIPILSSYLFYWFL